MLGSSSSVPYSRSLGRESLALRQVANLTYKNLAHLLTANNDSAILHYMAFLCRDSFFLIQLCLPFGLDQGVVSVLISLITDTPLSRLLRYSYLELAPATAEHAHVRGHGVAGFALLPADVNFTFFISCSV
ncbi:hypothetical protein K470DRAFT_86448 [Piedraia hortae CBS 480.64]|uniref:Uncharacterized protein n=1 Tax=Piedraia hortae CBS 480.64 TaxID=1314780 RepID=A0A6A7BY51_9PEZI|nr:hypothetical protein K470DRAFT_86448 [Piedraia hortae CBS 480.64]